MNTENQKNDHELRGLLKQSVPPVTNTELSRDLWPRMLGRLMQESSPVSWPRVHWFDWVLAALAGAAVVFYPGILPALFYHF